MIEAMCCRPGCEFPIRGQVERVPAPGRTSPAAATIPAPGKTPPESTEIKVEDPKSHESVEDQIRATRESLHKFEKTILFSHILMPCLKHGSHLIYAPDEVAWAIASKVYRGMLRTPDAYRDAKAGLTDRWKLPRVKEVITNNWPIIVSFTVGLYIFHEYGQDLKCMMQNTFVGWAEWNRHMNYVARFFSICALMIVRLLVSNVFPFTSPAFAYIIAKSQGEGEEYLGAFYLLACSMPSGGLVPLLDELARRYTRGGEGERTEEEFLATEYLSLATDYLPFSFWVRPFFMEPAFLAAKKADVGDNAGAAAAAVLAGHFMIWSGPATTMHQRKFVPDIYTCIFIQPLGLMEDVAVILATWAGGTPTNQKDAQIALFAFMLLMNVVQYIASRRSHAETHAASSIRHLFVGISTLVALAWKWHQPLATTTITVTTTTTTTITAPLCATEHSNVHAIIGTVLQVSMLAIGFSVLAKVLVKFKTGLSVREQYPAAAHPPEDDKANVREQRGAAARSPRDDKARPLLA